MDIQNNDEKLPENLIPNEETIKAMNEARQGGLKSFESVEALMEDLNEDD